MSKYQQNKKLIKHIWQIFLLENIRDLYIKLFQNFRKTWLHANILNAVNFWQAVMVKFHFVFIFKTFKQNK